MVLRFVLAIAVVVGHATVRAQQSLPAGPGAEVIKARCISCHEADLISSQRLAATGWTREIDKMVRWGATVSAQPREVLQTYLVANFGPRPSVSHASQSGETQVGEVTFKRACLACHGVDLIEQQRLGRAAWVREVEKMMHWGAAVTATEKDPLVDHLADRFGVR